ncbi:putative YigZ family protein [Alkalihalobacillus xiaoxiensis]|uniref:YigZ family protein n=1 Tax=Shouchella xiaoxiensis TaxID=766895 RepID=A0ABS2SY20_9BACI|nr:YigZ family protein [Shouchella xiaoxiensis]MBM7840428.1 putative YigZ family protein [Shouchella xiaoxiensis]
MLPSYNTVKKTGQAEMIVQKSRFIAHFMRTETEEEAIAFIAAIKKEHGSANHNCSAYLIGENSLIQKANDDGEPSGTAGVPMLEVLKKKDLKDTTVVVTRYFGGVKLGAGGLIRAYGSSVSEGLKQVGIVNRKLSYIVEATVDYTWLGKLENEIRQSGYLLKEIVYLEKVVVRTYVEEAFIDSFYSWITEVTNGQAELNNTEAVYLETDVV